MIAEALETRTAGIVGAIERASARTGADFDYLLRTAMRESSLDPQARARTSTATGLFQFIEQTWLAMVKRHGADHGLAAYAEAITQRADGRYIVADRQIRQSILDLRKDPDLAATMAGELAETSEARLEAALGRKVRAGELYAAHFLGDAGAVRLIRLAEREPGADASAHFPDAAAANRAIFYRKDGTARSAAEVYRRVAALPEPPAHVAMAAANAASSVPPAGVTPTPEPGVFRTIDPRLALRQRLLADDDAMVLRAGVPVQAPAAPRPDAPATASAGPRPLLLTPDVVRILASLERGSDA